MQNVDINKEVQRAMMSPPQQPRGIIDLLASELKAQDAQAKNKIRAMMAGSPPQDTVLAQNEKTAEDSVRQEIAQKMQAMAVKERQNQARMNRALQGIAAQSAPNMRMMDGGIVGYQAGGNVQTPPKPTMGAVPPSGVGNDQIKQYAEEYMGIKKALENPENAQYKERNQMLLQDLIRQMGDQMPAVMQYIDSMKGIVEPRGFQEGGGIFGPTGIFGPSARAASSFTQFLASKGIESLAGLSEAASRRLMEEFLAQKSAGDRRTELAEMAGAPGSEGARQAQPEIPERPYIPTGRASVADSQMENLGGVLRGAGNVLREGIASPPSAGEREATEAQRESGRRGPGALFEGIAGLAPRGKSDVQRELEAAERRMQREQGTDGDGLSLTKVREFVRGLTGETEEQRAARLRRKQLLDENFFRTDDLKTGVLFSGVPSLEELKTEVPEDAEPGYLQGARTLDVLSAPFNIVGGFLYPDPEAGEDFGSATLSDVGDVLGGFGRGLVGAEPRRTGETPTQQTDAEVAQEIIATAPSTEDADAAAMQGVPQIANPSLRAAIEATQEGAQEAPAPTQEAIVDTASAVAQNPTPENTSRFESEIQRLMERRESPIRALSSFLTAFSQARGGSMGQNLAIATTAMRAADDALDNQIIELEKLRRADQISERDFSLKQDELEAQKGLLQAQANYYANYRDMQEEIARIKAQEGVDAANRRLLQAIMETAGQNEYFYRMVAQKELGIDDIASPEVTRRTERIKQQSIRDAYNEAQRYFRLSEGTGAGNFGDQFADTMTVTP